MNRITIRTATTLSRFWRTVTLEQTPQNAFRIMLDNRILKSPDGKVIEIKNRHVALFVAAEWEAQTSVLKAHSLPLTSIITRSNELQETPGTREKATKTLFKYLDTDTVLYHHDFPEPLVRLQEKYWVPFLATLSERMGLSLKHTTGLTAIAQAPETIAYLDEEVKRMSPLAFSAFEKAVLTSKSFLIGFALVKKWISVELAMLTSRVEVLSQIERWGEVEDTHDVDREEMKRCLGAASICVMESRNI